MIFFSPVWPGMALYGPLLPCMAMYDPVGHGPMVPFVFVWSCTALYCPVVSDILGWFHMVPHGSECLMGNNMAWYGPN